MFIGFVWAIVPDKIINPAARVNKSRIFFIINVVKLMMLIWKWGANYSESVKPPNEIGNLLKRTYIHFVLLRNSVNSPFPPPKGGGWVGALKGGRGGGF